MSLSYGRFYVDFKHWKAHLNHLGLNLGSVSQLFSFEDPLSLFGRPLEDKHIFQRAPDAKLLKDFCVFGSF